MAEKAKKSHKILISIGIIVLAIILVAGWAYFSLTGSNTVSAQLHVEAGKVFVNGNLVSGNVILKERDSIQTGADGQAAVILYESIVINLEPNTKIILADLVKSHPQIEQESGETWNKLTNLAGIGQYSVKTGNSVASVRGTAFGIKGDKILVGEGRVEYTINNKKFDLNAREVVETLGNNSAQRIANSEELGEIKAKMAKTIEELRYTRQLEIEKHKLILEKIKGMYNLTDRDINKALEDADNGLLNIGELVAKSPVEVKSIQKIADITREIKRIKEEINS